MLYDLWYARILMDERDREMRDRHEARAMRPVPCCDEGRLALLRRLTGGRRASTCAC